jgi:glycosyltransferase involved in cell wall biosynthesis
MYGYPTSYLPYCVFHYLASHQVSAEAARSAREQLGIQPSELMLSTFGFVDVSKGIYEIVDALRILHARGTRAHLYLVGQASLDKAMLLRTVDDLGLLEFIHMINEWIDADRYRQYLIATDVGIQLRTHGFGGLSGALMDCIAAGVPVVANADLADSMESPTFVRRVPDALNPTDIADAVTEQLLKVESYRARDHEGLRAEYVRSRSPERYAELFMRELQLT